MGFEGIQKGEKESFPYRDLVMTAKKTAYSCLEAKSPMAIPPARKKNWEMGKENPWTKIQAAKPRWSKWSAWGQKEKPKKLGEGKKTVNKAKTNTKPQWGKKNGLRDPSRSEKQQGRSKK